MFQSGTRLAGPVQQLARNVTLETGKAYHVVMQASQGIIDPKGVADYLVSKLWEQYPEIQVKWLKVCETKQTISFQFTVVSRETLTLTPRTTSLTSGELLVWLPSILSLIGIAMIFISIYAIWGAVPTWVWATLVVGTVLFFFGSGIAEKIFRLR